MIQRLLRARRGLARRRGARVGVGGLRRPRSRESQTVEPTDGPTDRPTDGATLPARRGSARGRYESTNGNKKLECLYLS
jgi:hypothetical protein